MITRADIRNNQIAVYDPDRKGIFIHKDQLQDCKFKVGDKFSVKKGQKELFALTIIKDDNGDIIYDKTGIFVERTRRVDMFLGGIFDEYVIFLEADQPNTIKIKPLEMTLKGDRL
ncbi:MAG: hypothetical protein JSV83_08665 [Desulfobacterales bacterium]|nr:MAG: hypothetical protein JSV83_08665 [Desulfobacterales bacterium]